jgi:hypothetical protein
MPIRRSADPFQLPAQQGFGEIVPGATRKAEAFCPCGATAAIPSRSLCRRSRRTDPDRHHRDARHPLRRRRQQHAGLVQHRRLWAQAAGSGALTVTSGTMTAHLTLLGSYVTSDFKLFGDGRSGALVTHC